MKRVTNKQILMAAIRPSPQLWTREISEEDVTELADSVEREGFLNPVTVRPMGKAGRHFELIAGMRRYMAHKQLKLKRIDARVMNVDDQEARAISLVENLQQKHLTPHEQAEAEREFYRLVRPDHEEPEEPEVVEAPKKRETKAKSKSTRELLGKRGPKKTSKAKAIEDVAKRIGKSPQKVARDIKIMDNLCAVAAKAFKEEKITLLQAEKLADMSVNDQCRQVPLMIKETREETRRRLKQEEEERSSGPTVVAQSMLVDILELCEKLRPKVEELKHFLDGKDIDYKVLWKMPLKTGSKTAQLLSELIDFVAKE